MRYLSIFSFALLLLSCSNSKKEEAKTLSRHSEAFNNSVQLALDNYRQLTEAFVNWDSAKVVKNATDVKTALSKIPLKEFSSAVKQTADSLLNGAQQNLDAMTVNISLTEKKHRLNSLTQNLYNFLNTTYYDEKKIYLQECPMAFNDTISGNWLSEVDSIRNPYMGLHHPHYGKAMIECGNTKSAIDFVGKK